MKVKKMTIQGMSCGHCVKAVEQELRKVPGLEIESIEIGKAVVRYDETQVDMDTVRKAVEEAGYMVGS